MTLLLMFSGAIAGGVLGWLFDRRFIKCDNKGENTREQQAPT